MTERLEHIAKLGAAAVWLSPVYPSPNADFGYDVSDYQAIDPGFGTLADFDALVARAHDLGLKVVLDYVPCHTSIEHRWFREHPEYYVWADEIPNNWRAAFGGSGVGARLADRPLLPELVLSRAGRPGLAQPRRAHRDGRRAALLGSARGRRLPRRCAGPDRQGPGTARRASRPRAAPLPLDPKDAELEHLYSRNFGPQIAPALEAIRDAVGDALLIGEVFLPTAQLGPYLEYLDVCFSFETLFAAGDATALTEAIATGVSHGGVGWVLSNHDFDRLATRAGTGNARALALLLLTLPGPVFIYQGDELGMANSAPSAPDQDRHGRDNLRMPMRWDESAHAGFTRGTPWLTTDEPEAAPVSVAGGRP